jgi:hypothetical protein
MTTTYIRMCLHFYRTKKEKKKTIHCLLTLLKNWCVFWSPKMIKVDFEAVVISAINKVFLDAIIAGCNFHFNQYGNN